MCDYSQVPPAELASMIAYNATVLAAAPAWVLQKIWPDLVEAAIALIPAAEFAEREPGGARGPAPTCEAPLFLHPPRTD